MAAYPEYTKCVLVEEYRKPSFKNWLLVGVGFGAAGLAWPPLALVAVFSFITALREYCDYVLERKLICLGGDRCALGAIVLFDPPLDSPFGDGLVDNDYGINLMLFPLRLDDFVKLLPGHLVGGLGAPGSPFELAQSSPQGRLVKPRPKEEEDSFPEVAKNRGHAKFIPPKAEGAFVTGDIEGTATSDNMTAAAIGGVNMEDLPEEIPIDVLHCEIEGSRGYVMRMVIDGIRSLGFGSGFCKIPFLGWVVCAAATVLLAPFILAAVAAAWWLAEEGNPKQVLVNPEDGELHPGDLVVIKGRWVQDADDNHGWNELHPVKAIQKIRRGPRPNVGEMVMDLNLDTDIAAHWRDLFCEVPPDPNERPRGSIDLSGGPGGSGSDQGGKPPPKPAGMTPGQEKVYSAQTQPENGWKVHPVLDGCNPNTPNTHS